MHRLGKIANAKIVLMSIKTEIYFDPRTIRKKSNDYPYRLRVYAGKAKLYATVFGLSKEDNDKLTAKNLRAGLQEIRDKLQEIERTAAEAVKKIDPFSFEVFERDYIKDNPYFDQTYIKAKPITTVKTEFNFNPYHKRFPILMEESAPGTMGEIFKWIIKEKLSRGKVKTASGYHCAYVSLRKCWGNIPLKWITTESLYAYKEWMKRNTDNNRTTRSKTTIGIYTRKLRTVFNVAIEKNIIKKENCYPFGGRGFIIPGSSNIKKAFTGEELQQIYYFPCDPKWPQMGKFRAYWFFLLFCQGLNPKDMANLQFKNIVDGFIEFERSKTEDSFGDDAPKIRAFITPDMQRTMDEFGNKDKNPENYIFPILKAGMEPLRQMDAIEYFIKTINKWVQRILDALGIQKDAGCQVARHSYATLRRLAGASLVDIQEELGQKNPNTTKRYVASLPCERKKEIAHQLESFKTLSTESLANSD